MCVCVSLPWDAAGSPWAKSRTHLDRIQFIRDHNNRPSHCLTPKVCFCWDGKGFLGQGLSRCDGAARTGASGQTQCWSCKDDCFFIQCQRVKHIVTVTLRSFSFDQFQIFHTTKQNLCFSLHVPDRGIRASSFPNFQRGAEIFEPSN